ncbi:MAG: phosphoglycerate dehydrogenase [Terrimicrobiaceae bacterium]|nr:phosphoglycerate dehydrogenase [Terrimicrobiaceae bacterium]
MRKILVTPRSVTRSGHPSLEKLRDARCEVVFCRPGQLPNEDELLDLLPGCAGYLAGVETISARALEAARELKVISRNGTGTDAVDLAAAERLGIRVLRAEGANARGVAELTVAMILALARSLSATDRAIKAGGWERCPGFELEGKTLGLLGCGRVGRLVTGFALALGMRVLASDPVANWQDAPPGFSYADRKEVYAQSDVLSLHCPPGADGRPALDRAALAGLKNGILVINTARGGLIDADAMLEALESGHVAGLALDAFEQEPPDDRRLTGHPRVIATPHIGGYTPESIDRAMNVAVENLLKELDGASLPTKI